MVYVYPHNIWLSVKYNSNCFFKCKDYFIGSKVIIITIAIIFYFRGLLTEYDADLYRIELSVCSLDSC